MCYQPQKLLDQPGVGQVSGGDWFGTFKILGILNASERSPKKKAQNCILWSLKEHPSNTCWVPTRPPLGTQLLPTIVPQFNLLKLVIQASEDMWPHHQYGKDICKFLLCLHRCAEGYVGNPREPGGTCGKKQWWGYYDLSYVSDHYVIDKESPWFAWRSCACQNREADWWVLCVRWWGAPVVSVHPNRIGIAVGADVTFNCRPGRSRTFWNWVDPCWWAGHPSQSHPGERQLSLTIPRMCRPQTLAVTSVWLSMHTVATRRRWTSLS